MLQAVSGWNICIKRPENQIPFFRLPEVGVFHDTKRYKKKSVFFTLQKSSSCTDGGIAVRCTRIRTLSQRKHHQSLFPKVIKVSFLIKRHPPHEGWPVIINHLLWLKKCTPRDYCFRQKIHELFNMN